jgi:hypothetical protein
MKKALLRLHKTINMCNFAYKERDIKNTYNDGILN